ncbi:hypothetical protein FOZ60_000316 [Perkinsus olseni]|uniref:Reverse transcriptase domain-containing protein n=1 Tax=Perkinsus olseni TaxID=32597 RepID=A0A7J6P3P1_PEROL|nr:hypothetical protein FOZ60_000316 [Perkinsus olseni]
MTTVSLVPDIDLPVPVGVLLMALEGVFLLVLQFDKRHISNFAARKLCHAGTGLLMLCLNSKYIINRLFIYALVVVSLTMTWELTPKLPNWRFGIYGDVGITIYLLVVGLWYYVQLPIVVLAPVFFADPAGAVVGRWATRNVPEFNPPWVGSKTVLGSAAVLIVAFFTLHSPARVLPRLLVAVIAAMVEAIGGKYDNLCITAVVLTAWWAKLDKGDPPPRGTERAAAPEYLCVAATDGSGSAMARHGRRSLSSRVCRRKKWGIGAKAAITGLDYNDVPAHVLYEDKLCIIQANVCGIRQRLPLLQGRARSADASVIVACETKIDGTVEAGSLAIKGYTLISRKDRSAHGGGILVWAKTSLNATEIDTADVAEASWILVATVIGNVCICCCYRPPGSTAVDAYLPRSLGKVTIFDPIVTLLVGDFNRHDLDSLYTSTRSLGLKQLIREPTHVRGGTLDMVFTNSDGGCVMTSVDPIEARISDHVCITTTIPLLLSTNSSKATRRGWDFRHADWKGFRAYVHRKLRRRLLSGGCPDRAVSHLESVLHSGMEIFIKAVDIPTGCNSVPWWDNACTDAVASLVRDPTADSRRVALGLIEAKRHEYCDMVREKLTEGRLSCKQFHRLAKELSLSTKAKSCSIPPLELADGVLTTDDSAKAEALAQHFQSKMVLPDSDGPFDAGPRVPDSASTTSLLVDPCDVMSILKRLNVSKAAGPSRIGPRVFRELASILAPPLASLYNNIFRRCQWPRSWKISNICPIYKRKSRRDVRNYRPIALLEIPSRIFERIVSQKLVTHALKNNVIAPDQAAFLPGRGTGDVMWEFVSDAISAMNSRQTWHVLQTDIAGAFDRVDRALLLRRLENAGIRGRLCNLLQNSI